MPTCFVVMGFGEKTDLATGRKLNLDMSYKNIVKPAVEAAGYTCVRADEIRHSGLIDVPMYDMLLTAELVVADLSTSNLNAMFELGVRHALKPRSTIIIADKQFASPFDVNHIVVRKYEHLGTDIGFAEAMRMRKDLEELIKAIRTYTKPDSPVYSLIPRLRPPALQGDPAAADIASPTVPFRESYAARWEQAVAAKSAGDFEAAKSLLRDIYASQASLGDDDGARTPRPRVIQELALATYKLGDKAGQTGGPAVMEHAYAEAIELLRMLDPERTTDPETLGLWSAVHKRRAELSTRTDEERRADLDVAIYASERGFLIRQDHYNGGNLAYLLDVRAGLSQGDDEVADRVLAARVRRRVVEIARARIEALTKALQISNGKQSNELKDEAYWVHASLAEALIGIGDPSGVQAFKDARAYASAPWMVETTINQLKRLLALRQSPA